RTWWALTTWTTPAKRSIRAGKANDPARYKPTHQDDAVARPAGRCGTCGNSDAPGTWRAAGPGSPEFVRILGGGDPPARGASRGEQRVGNDAGPGRALAALFPTAFHAAS